MSNGGQKMPVFDLDVLHTYDEQDSSIEWGSSDELYLEATFHNYNDLAVTYELGGSHDRGEDHNYPSNGYPPVYFGYSGPTTISLWEDDGVGDDLIDSFTINNDSDDDQRILKGKGGRYFLEYDIT
jgi:hypothetical protein